MDGKFTLIVLFPVFLVAVVITLSQMQVTPLSVIVLGAFMFILYDCIKTG